jgi:hypothetical protein
MNLNVWHVAKASSPSHFLTLFTLKIRKLYVLFRNRFHIFSALKLKDMSTMEIGTDLCEFVGAVIGNGNLWTDGLRYRVELTGDPKLEVEYVKHFSALSNDLFGKKPYALRIHERGLRWGLQSKEAYIMLQTLGILAGNGKSHKVTIPD